MEATHAIAGALKDGVNSASALLTDLMQHAAWVRQWWAARNTKPGAGVLPGQAGKHFGKVYRSAGTMMEVG